MYDATIVIVGAGLTGPEHGPSAVGPTSARLIGVARTSAGHYIVDPSDALKCSSRPTSREDDPSAHPSRLQRGAIPPGKRDRSPCLPHAVHALADRNGRHPGHRRDGRSHRRLRHCEGTRGDFDLIATVTGGWWSQRFTFSPECRGFCRPWFAMIRYIVEARACAEPGCLARYHQSGSQRVSCSTNPPETSAVLYGTTRLRLNKSCGSDPVPSIFGRSASSSISGPAAQGESALKSPTGGCF